MMWGGSSAGATSVSMGAFIKSVNDQRRSSVGGVSGKGLRRRSAEARNRDGSVDSEAGKCVCLGGCACERL